MTLRYTPGPKGVPPPNDVWPDWSGKQMAVARSPPGAPSGPWNVSWLFKKAELPQDWWHWDCSSTNPSALVAADGTVQMLYVITPSLPCFNSQEMQRASVRGKKRR